MCICGMASSLHCIFDKACTTVEHKSYSQHDAYEDTDQTYIAKEALLPVTEGKYPEWNLFHIILYSDRDFKQSNTGVKVHIYYQVTMALNSYSPAGLKI